MVAAVLPLHVFRKTAETKERYEETFLRVPLRKRPTLRAGPLPGVFLNPRFGT